MLYSTFLGGRGLDCQGGGYGHCAIAAGADGSAYITGHTCSSDFPTTPGSFDPVIHDSCYRGQGGDIFVTHLDLSGRNLVYSTFLGGSAQDTPTAIAVDGDGAVLVTGGTISRDYPTTPGAYDLSYNGTGEEDDVVLTKLNPAGSGLVYSTFLGGGLEDLARGLALGTDGSAYVSGNTNSDDFPTTPGAYDRTHDISQFFVVDAFVTKFSPDGRALAYSTYLGGTANDFSYSLAVDGSGQAYATGRTGSGDFPTTPGAYDRSYHGGLDAFVAALNASGSALVYSTYLGGGSAEDSRAVAVDASGAAYVTGNTESSDFPTTPGAYDTTLDEGEVFITKINPAGTTLEFSTFLGGGSGEYGYGIALAADGSVYVAGWTSSYYFPTTPGALQTHRRGGVDAFLTRLQPDGSALLYSTFLGGGIEECGIECTLAIDAQGAVYLTGDTGSVDFPVTPGAFQTTFQGDHDGFISRISPDLPSLHVASIQAGYQPSGNRYRVGARVLVQDANQAPVAGASVRLQVALPDGRTSSVTRTTNQQGRATVSFGTGLSGTYTFTVTHASKTGWIYNPARNGPMSAMVVIP